MIDTHIEEITHLLKATGEMIEIRETDETPLKKDMKDHVEAHQLKESVIKVHTLIRKNLHHLTKNPAKRAKKRSQRTKKTRNTRKRSPTKNIKSIHQAIVAVTVVAVQVHRKQIVWVVAKCNLK